jgi:hypothetical protein
MRAESPRELCQADMTFRHAGQEKWLANAMPSGCLSDCASAAGPAEAAGMKRLRPGRGNAVIGYAWLRETI